MPSPALPDFPLWGQITLVLGFLGTGVGIIRKAWKSEPKPGQAATDTLVVSGEFTDGKLIKGLTQAIADNTSMTERFDRNQANRSAELRDAMEAGAHAQRAGNAILGELRDMVARGVRIAPAPPDG